MTRMRSARRRAWATVAIGLWLSMVGSCQAGGSREAGKPSRRMRPSRVVRGIRNRAAARERLPRAWRKASSIRLRSCCASASRRPPTAALFIERGLAAHGLGAVVGERHLIQQCAALPVQQQAAPDHVFQLPDVARPVAGQQLRQRPLAKSGDTRVEAARIATDERPCQQFHIAGALRSGGMHRLPTSRR